MTFIAGYIYNNATHIVADSATTIPLSRQAKVPDELHRIQSSLGESPHITDEQIIVEADPKIYNIADRMLVAFAGRVLEGTQTIQDLTIQLGAHPRVADFLSLYFDQNILNNTEYVIAFHEDGLPCIFLKRPNESRLIRGQRCLVLAGTTVNNMHVAVGTTLQDAFEHDYSQQETLVSVLTILQAMSMHFQSIRATRNGFSVGIGGHFNGAIAHHNHIEWAKDTAHVFYSAINWERGDKWFMFRYNRDNATFIIGDRLKRLFTHEREANRQHLMSKWAGPLTDMAIHCSCDFISFISYDRRNLVVVNNDPSKAHRVKIESGRLEISSNSPIGRHLFLNSSEDEGGNAPFLCYTNFV